MAEQVFISYSHESETTVKTVNLIRRTLLRVKVNVIYDEDISKLEANAETWQDLIEQEFKKSKFVIVVLDEAYCEAYEKKYNNEEILLKGKGIAHEIRIIKADTYNKGKSNKYIYVKSEDLKNEKIPSILTGQHIFNWNNQKSRNELVKELSQVSNKNLIYDESVDSFRDRSVDFFRGAFDNKNLEFINRISDRRQLTSVIKANDEINIASFKGKIIEITGSPHIGKTTFVKEVISHCSENLDTLEIREQSEIYKDTVKIVKGCLSLNDISSDRIIEHVATIDTSEKHNVLVIDGYEKFFDEKVFLEISNFHKHITNELYTNRFNPEKSDFSIILVSRQKLPTPLINSQQLSKHETIHLKSLEKLDIQHVLESYLFSEGKRKSEKFNILINSIWEISSGLPGALQKVFEKIKEDKSYIYHLVPKNKENINESDKINAFYDEYINDNFLSQQCLEWNKNIKHNYHQDLKKKLIKEICVYRKINKEIFSIATEKINKEVSNTHLKSNRDTMKGILDSLCFIDYANTSHEIYCPIRKIMTNFFFKTKEEKTKAHHKALLYYQSKAENSFKNLSLLTSLNTLYLFEEVIWHSVEIARIDNHNATQLANTLKEKIKCIYLKISDQSERLEAIEETQYHLSKRENKPSIAEIINSFNEIEQSENFKDFLLDIFTIGDKNDTERNY